MTAKPTTAAFFSYVRADDEFEQGRISRLRERLEKAIHFYWGRREFRIFQDWKDIGFGQRWEKVIAESIEHSLVLFAVVTPSYFSSDACRNELLAFEKRQTRLGRDDLILPIYYVDNELMSDFEDESVGAHEAKAARLIQGAQFEDWRPLRRTAQSDRAYDDGIERLAQRAIPALKRGMAARAQSTTAEPGPSPTADEPSEKEPSLPGHAAAEKTTTGYFATVTVDQMPGRGEFTTISEAITRAAPGARIRIRQGHYREQLVINKPLELVGDGAREDIVVEAHDTNTLVFDTNIGVVRGLTFKQSGAGKYFLALIKQGIVVLEECDLSGGTMSSLAVSSGADPRVRRNSIHNSREAGIVIFEQGLGIYEDNEIFANGFQGVSLKDHADPIVRRNRIYENKQAGVRVYEKGRGTIEDNEIFGNESAGVSVSEEADPIVRRNRIHENKHSGIYVREKCRGTIENNEILANGRAGLRVTLGAAPLVRNNRVNKNGYAAVWVDKGGAGVYNDNDLRENNRGPWDIRASAGAGLSHARNIEE
jgi:F-box protein 11